MNIFWLGAEFGFGICFAIYICDFVEKAGKYLINKFWQRGKE